LRKSYEQFIVDKSVKYLFLLYKKKLFSDCQKHNRLIFKIITISLMKKLWTIYRWILCCGKYYGFMLLSSFKFFRGV